MARDAKCCLWLVAVIVLFHMGNVQPQVWHTSSWATVLFKFDCGFGGYDFEQSIMPISTCQASCARNSRCTHFTWYPDSTCTLKSFPAGTAQESDVKDAVCGYVPSRYTTQSPGTRNWQAVHHRQVPWAQTWPMPMLMQKDGLGKHVTAGGVYWPFGFQ